MTGLYPVFKEGGRGDAFFNVLESATGLRVLPFTCGRAAIAAGLKVFNLSRTDEVMVPPYLSQCVLSAISRNAFPAMTPLSRTRAVLVFHQFGFPQDIAGIESVARDRGWIILNDCAHTIFTRVNGRFLMDWGDFTIISLAKLYPCGLGGGFYSRRADIYEKVFAEHEKLSGRHVNRVEQAFERLMKANSGYFGDESVFEINSLFGYLPDLLSFPSKAYSALPDTGDAMEKNIDHRKNIWSIVKGILPDRVPVCEGAEIVPFAVPVSGDASELERISQRVRKELSLDAPVLHFDFAMNMLKPDYRKSLVIGCHEGWKEEFVIETCEMIKRGIV